MVKQENLSLQWLFSCPPLNDSQNKQAEKSKIQKVCRVYNQFDIIDIDRACCPTVAQSTLSSCAPESDENQESNRKKIYETKNQVCEKINKSGKHLLSLIRTKKTPQMINIRSERKDMSLALTYIRRLTRKCHEQLYVYGLHSFDEMDFRDDNTLQIITILSNYWY